MSQQGGMVGSFQLLLTNLDSPEKFVYGVFLILIIVYSSEIPSEYRIFMDSILGRVFGIAIIYGITEMLGWVYGILTAIAFLLVLNGASRTLEGFDGGGSVSEKNTIGNRWFVEKVLRETPSKIAVDKVTTTAIEI
jgi:hypothetical protein